ncbi:acyltransferase [Colwellia sp. 1_MG-2023]|uniref:acyltransferase family protein n=1 Tax=Colwellia sp. 1_MG-2023 TaxID=3062649 RepID=UPI0026E1B5C5|nr:acyltransferase [Colwellia sp. 1_MG-2023]MDO6445293.1 acyltransferase [Colwellia sp. 1_MG-2023]
MNIRFYEIDLFRFLAAFGVMVFHYTYTAFMEGYAPIANFENFREVSRYAYMGINFFFIISGFVIFMSVKDGSAKKFVISRFVRLFPTYWAALILTSLITVYWGGVGFSITWPQFFANTTMINEAFNYKPIDGAYWTLFIELKFYIFIWALLLCGALQYIQHILAFTLIVSTAALFFPWAENVNMWTGIFPHWSGYFASGCVLYLLRRDGINLYRMGLYILSFIYIIIQSVLFGSLMGKWFDIIFDSTTIILINLVFFAVFSLTAFCKDNHLRKRWCFYLGILTYPLYLTHQHIGYIIFNQFGTESNIVNLIVLTILLMVVVAYLIHYFIEIKLSRSLSRWLTKRFLVIRKLDVRKKYQKV